MTALVISPGSKPVLFLHEMYVEKIKNPSNLEIEIYSDGVNPVKLLIEYFSEIKRIGVDKSWPSMYLINILNEIEGLKVFTSSIVEDLREIKDPSEINLLRQSARISDAVMHQITQLQHFPTTEKMICKNIRDFFNEHGVEEFSFQPIIGFGKNTANPHHTSSNVGVSPDQPILIDMGGVYNNYCSDITRMHYFGSSNEEYESFYDIVKNVQMKAIEMVRPGVAFSEIDEFIRKEFSKWNYEEHFIHRTGHGIGLELHEGPYIHSGNHDYIQEGMVFTIEPGLYLPDKYGVRIEDVVAVNEKGCEVLNLQPKELQYLNVFSNS